MRSTRAATRGYARDGSRVRTGADGACLQIALQFPDELLHDAVPVFRAIRDRLPQEKELYVLADTTYGR